MAKESTFKNMVISLGLICLICSALLAVVYVGTKDTIDAATVAKTNDAISKVLPSFDNTPGEEGSVVEMDGAEHRVYTARKGDEVVGYAIESSATGFGGEIDIMVGFDTSNDAIYNVFVISHSETPGLGAKISDDSQGNFKEQFKGFKPSESVLMVTKDGGDIDAITASTVTSRAFTSAVSKAYDVYKALMEGNSSAESGSDLKNTIEGGVNNE